MDNTLMRAIDGYMAFLRTQYTGDTIPTMTYNALVYQNLEESKKLGHERYRQVLNCIANFANRIYSIAPLKPYARNYVVMLAKELTALKSDHNVLHLMALVKKYGDDEGYEAIIAVSSPNVNKLARWTVIITRAVCGAIYGTLIGAILSSLLWLVRGWLKF